MDQKLIEHINTFTLAASAKPLRACAMLGLTQDGHDKVLYCWLTNELETPECLYEFISLCTQDPKRNDLGTTEWWKTRQKHFSDGMGYLYGMDGNNQALAENIPRNLTPDLFGDKGGISTIEPNCFGGIGDKIWQWMQANSGGTGWIQQTKITKRFQNICKGAEINKVLDSWLKEGKIEHQKFMPNFGRPANIYRINPPATESKAS